MIKNNCTARPHVHVKNEEMSRPDRENCDVSKEIDVEGLDGVFYRLYNDHDARREVQGLNRCENLGNMLPFGLEGDHKVSLPPF